MSVHTLGRPGTIEPACLGENLISTSHIVQGEKTQYNATRSRASTVRYTTMRCSEYNSKMSSVGLALDGR